MKTNVERTLLMQMRVKRAGVTLLEILLATCVLALTMIPIAGLIGVGFRSSSKDFRTVIALQLLESTLNQVLTADYEKIPTGSDIKKTIDLGSGNSIILGTIASQGISFSMTLNVEEINTSFDYKPVLVENSGFIATSPSTWSFGGATSLVFDNSSNLQRRRVKKVEAVTSWLEQPQALTKTIKMISYLAQLKE